MADKPNTYVAFAACGCCVGLSGTAPHLAKHVVEFLRQGLDVKLVDWPTLQSIMKDETFLNCPHRPKQLPLEEIP